MSIEHNQYFKIRKGRYIKGSYRFDTPTHRVFVPYMSNDARDLATFVLNHPEGVRFEVWTPYWYDPSKGHWKAVRPEVDGKPLSLVWEVFPYLPVEPKKD